MFDVEATFISNSWSSSMIRIIPDDCIESLYINNKIFDVSNLKNRCSWSSGVVIDLDGYLEDGTNTIKLKVYKKDSVGGVNMFGIFDASTSYLIAKMLMMLLLFIAIILFSQKELRIQLAVVFAIGVALQFHYLSYTDYATRTFDLLISTGHLDYIEMIANKLTLPNPMQGWEYHQPPLYYLLAAFVYKFAEVIPFVNQLLALQLLSLSLFCVFLYYGLKILILTIKDNFILLVVALLFVLWPSGIIHSIRIGNDILLFALFAVAMYHILRWQMSNGSLVLPLLFASLALITKANGIILFGVIGILLILELFKTKDARSFFKNTGLSFIFFGVAFSVNFSDNIYYAMQNTSQDWLVSNVVNTINKNLFVANEPINYLYFDFTTYIKEPFIDAWNDKYGRQFFWNYLFKSALFSEFFFNSKNTIALLMAPLSLIIFIFILFGIVVAPKDRATAVMNLVLFLSILILLLYRIKIPVACNTDFRYIYPVIIPMTYFYASALVFFKTKQLRVTYVIGFLVPIVFSISSFIVFV